MAPKKNEAPTKNPPKVTQKIRKAKKRSKSARSGLTFPVGRVQRHLHEGGYAKRIGTGAAIYMAGVLEYLSSELLELSGDSAMHNKRKRITPRDVMKAISEDGELSELLKDVTLPYAGVNPFIHPVLLPKSTTKKNQQEPEQMEQVEQGDDEEEHEEEQQNESADHENEEMENETAEHSEESSLEEEEEGEDEEGGSDKSREL